MLKGIYLENSNKNVVRVLSMIEPKDIENNPIGEFVLISDYTDPPETENHMTINYPIYDKVNQEFKWIQVKYQNTVTNELLEIENLKVENNTLKENQRKANEKINMLTETLADMIGGAI